jgi:hypothetical protein
MMGYLASADSLTPATVRKALAYGTCTASFTISDFSLAGLQGTNLDKIDARVELLRKAVSF